MSKLRCTKCNDVIESVHRHDFRWCGCGTIFVDGGKDYLRCGGDLLAIRIVKEDGSEVPLSFVEDSLRSVADVNDMLYYNYE